MGYGYIRFIVRCQDCPAEFETTKPDAKRCPACRARHRKAYNLQYRQQSRLMKLQAGK